jgi:hypothetical protein
LWFYGNITEIGLIPKSWHGGCSSGSRNGFY